MWFDILNNNTLYVLQETLEGLEWVLTDDSQQKINDGRLVINQNTTFTGDANFISEGATESITINSGSIVFKRNDIPLTTIKNIRFGSVTTDFDGRGKVSFEGFKKPILILPSIRSFTSDSNIASLYCYAEEIDAEKNTYKFIISGTSEYHTPPEDIKILDKQVSFENSLSNTWKNMGIKFGNRETSWLNYDASYKKQSSSPLPDESIPFVITKYPEYKIICKRITKNNLTNDVESEDIIFEATYTATLTKIFNIETHWAGLGFHSDYGEYKFKLDFKDLGRALNSFKKYSTRKNVNFIIEIEIINADVFYNTFRDRMCSSREGGGDSGYREYGCAYYTKNSGVFKNFLTLNDFYDFFIEYSSETSEITQQKGEGEVQYIAMEIE